MLPLTNRRDFLRHTAKGVSAALLARSPIARAALIEPEPLAAKYQAHDEIVLGNTGIRTSRLAIGSGTWGSGGHSNQTKLGMAKFSALMVDGYHDNGLRFFDTADQYGSHPYVAAALKELPRDRVTVMTKTNAKTPEGVRADLDRFRRELGTEHIDIVLLHCMMDPEWDTKYRGCMDVLSEAKEKGVIRAHGVSCHTIGALRAAAKNPWVEIDLARLNPIGSNMDAGPETIVPILKQMKADGKGVIGMKILGQGDLRDKPAEAIRYALGTEVLDAFTIGAESRNEQENLVQRIAAA